MNEDLQRLHEMQMNEGTEEEYEAELKRERAERKRWHMEAYREWLSEQW